MEKVKILLKSPELHVIHASLDMIVRDFRQFVVEECGIAVDRQILIYKAQIMVDHRTLQSYDLEDGKYVDCLQFVDAANLNNHLMRLDLMYTRLDTPGHEKLVTDHNVNLLYMANCRTRDICERNIALLSREVNDRKTRKFPQSSSSSGSGTEKNTVKRKVNIKGSESASITLDLDLNSIVKVLKIHIEKDDSIDRIPWYRQILVYKGSIMADYRILKSYGLEGEDAARDSIHLLVFADAVAVNDNLHRVDLYSHELGESEIKSLRSESLLNLNKLYTERLGVCRNNLRKLDEIDARPKSTGTSHPVQIMPHSMHMVDQQNVDSNYGGTSAGAGAGAGAGGDLLQRSLNLLRESTYPSIGALGQQMYITAQVKYAGKLLKLREMGHTDNYQNTRSLLCDFVKGLESAVRRHQNGEGTSGDMGHEFFSWVQVKYAAELSKLEETGSCNAYENTISLMFTLVRTLKTAVQSLQNPSH